MLTWLKRTARIAPDRKPLAAVVNHSDVSTGHFRRTPGQSPRVLTTAPQAVPWSVLKDRDRLDLDLRAGNRERRHLDERAGGTRLAEELLPHGVDRGPVADVGQEEGDLGDVREARSAGGQHRADVDQRLTRLGHHVVAADEASFAVHRDAAGDEQEPARPDRVRVVAERLGLPGSADLLAH